MWARSAPPTERIAHLWKAGDCCAAVRTAWVQRRKLALGAAERVLLSRRRRSKYPPDDFVAMRLETPAMAEHNALRSPRVDFCECCFSLSLLQ